MPPDRCLQQKSARLREARARAITQLEALQGDVRSAASSVRQAVEAARPQLSTQERLLSETEKGRVWQRYSRLLDGGIQPDALIGRAAGDLVALQALREELPAYLESRDGRLQRYNFPGQADGLLAAIDREERSLLPPEERIGRELGDELDAGMSQVASAFATAQGEVVAGMDATFLLPGWAAGTLIGVGSGA